MNIKRKIIAGIALTGVVLTGIVVAQSAQAAVISGTITVSPSTGSTSTDPFLSSVAVNQGCPAGFQDASVTSVVQGAINFNISNVRNPAQANPGGVYGNWGLGTSSISMDRAGASTNQYVSNNVLDAANLADGNFELRVYCFADRTVINSAKATSPWFSLTMSKTGTTWAVVVPAIATTTSLTASASGSTVSLSATIKDAAGSATLTAAAGNVAFVEGGSTITTSPVVAGVATASLTAVADGAHTYTAVFTPSNTVYSGSTSGTASVQVGGIVATSNITTTIPSGVGTLTLTGVSSSVALGTATLTNGVLFASGTLNAKVTDSRQLDYPAWSLTGQVGDFTKTGGGVLLGKYLGWIPSVSGTATGSAAGAIVEPSPVSVNGLKAISTLATGAPSAAGTITDASAVLQLKAPSNTPAGAYSATLTLTLI